MCGGVLNVEMDSSVVKCDYCGTVQTVPSFSSERKRSYFQRANDLRLQCEFDKASTLYEILVSEFPDESEAYWGLLLCKYGIEYIEEGEERIPTCHRLQARSILDDPDYFRALDHADVVARSVYEKEAKRMDGISKQLLQLSFSEEPFDIFICYKETDAMGQRTEDSVLAFDIYSSLIKEGYRVFFAKVTLEGKLGTEYEPYIFSALSSAKVMVHVTTSVENTNAVWVKNEWKRFLEKTGDGRVFIPCYRNILAEELPDEMKRFQGQDLGKIGAIQDLVYGINKILHPLHESAQRDVSDVVGQPPFDPLREEYEDNISIFKDIDSYYSVASDLDGCIRFFDRHAEYRDCGYYLQHAKLKYAQKVHNYNECVKGLAYLDELGDGTDTAILREEVEKKKRQYREKQLIQEGYAVNILEQDSLQMLLHSLKNLLAACRKLRADGNLSEDDHNIALQTVDRAVRYIDENILAAVEADHDVVCLTTFVKTLQEAAQDIQLSHQADAIVAAEKRIGQLTAAHVQEKRKKRMKLAVVLTAVILVVAIIVAAVVYIWMRREEGYSWENYDYYVISKVNDRFNEDLATGYAQAGYFYNLEIRIENHSPNDVTYLEGNLDIEHSVSGELLATFHVRLSGLLEAEKDAIWTLELRIDTSDEARTVWNASLSELNCYFRLDQIIFADETVKTYDDAKRVYMQ